MACFVRRGFIDTVAKAHIPVLIVTSEYSPAFEAVGNVLARLTGGHLVVRFPNHFVQLTNLGDLNAEVGAFMREADGTAPAPAAR